MQKLITEIKENRNLSDVTLNSYKTRLNKLSNVITNKPFRSKQFLLKEQEKILQFLDDLSYADKRAYLAAILVAIAPKGAHMVSNKNFNKVYKIYNALIKDTNNEYNKMIENNKKTEKDDERWLNWDQIVEIKNDYNNKLDQEPNNKTLLLHNMIISLYTMLPPRRLEYSNMVLITPKIYKTKSEEDLDNNIYLIFGRSKAFIHFAKYKVKSKTDQNEIVNVPQELFKIMKDFIKNYGVTKNDYFFKTIKGSPFSSNLFGKELKKIKNININLLRKSYLSNKYGSGILQQNEDARRMNHSKNVQQTVYVKL